jgi:RNA polymerase sigma-70 factor (sigma-E family)
VIGVPPTLDGRPFARARQLSERREQSLQPCPARRRRYWVGLADPRRRGSLACVISGQRPGKWIGGLLRLRSVSQEQQEFAEFYAASRDACLRAVIAGTGDAAQAEDMVAEAFARAWASWAKVRRYSAPRGWVVRAALNTGVSWWRPRRREIPLASHDAAALADPAEGLDAAVLAALRRLPARQREVIALRVFLDLDTQATAQVLGIAPGTVTAHLSRAAAALRSEPALHSLVAPSRARTTHDGGQQ